MLNRDELDEVLWNSWLQEKEGVKVFTDLSYLDQTAEKLCFLINANQTGGMALPFKSKAGVRTLYTPKFCRQIDWIGKNPPGKEELGKFLKKHFHVADIFMGEQLLKDEARILIHQKKEDSSAYRSQAKRRLKEAKLNDWTIGIGTKLDKAISFLEAELLPHVPSLNKNDFSRLHQLCSKLYQENKLQILELIENQKVHGYLLILQDRDRHIFLKGTCEHRAKQAGGMYFLMDHAISQAKAQDKIFDFGGSRVPGVRRFNKSFGSEDQVYFRYSWNKAPFWYRFIQYFRNRWIKK